MLHGWVSGTNKNVYVFVHPSILMSIYISTYLNPPHALHLSIFYLSTPLSLSRSLALSLSRAHTNAHAHRAKGLGGVRQRQAVLGQYRRVYPRTARLHCAWHKRVSLSLSFSLSPPLPLPLSHIHKYRCVLCMSPMARTASVCVPPCGVHHHRVHAACLKAANQCATLPEKAACPLCRRTHKAGSVCHASTSTPAMFPASRNGGSVAPSPGRPSL